MLIPPKIRGVRAFQCQRHFWKLCICYDWHRQSRAVSSKQGRSWDPETGGDDRGEEWRQHTMRTMMLPRARAPCCVLHNCLPEFHLLPKFFITFHSSSDLLWKCALQGFFARRQCLVRSISLFREILRDVRRSLCQKWLTLQCLPCFIKSLIHIKVQQRSCLIAAFLYTLKKPSLLSWVAI